MIEIYQHIVVAVDGSHSAEVAFKKAVHIAEKHHAHLTLMHVVDTRSFPSLEAYNAPIANQANAYAKELLEGYRNEANALGIAHVDTIIEYGSPKALIPKQSIEELHADLIICGATGLNAVERFLLGSVSEHVARSSSCDVLIVRS